MTQTVERYDVFSAAVKELAEAWQPDKRNQAFIPGTRAMYVAVGSRIMYRLCEELPKGTVNEANAASCEVISNFSFTAALLARQNHLTQPELVRRMRAIETFQTLAIAARVPIDISKTFEDMTGMRDNNNFGNDALKVGYYELGTEGIRFRDSDAALGEAIYNSPVDLPFNQRLSGYCPGLIHGVMRANFDAYVTIANRDPRLFAATLAADTVNGL